MAGLDGQAWASSQEAVVRVITLVGVGVATVNDDKHRKSRIGTVSVGTNRMGKPALPRTS